MSRYLVFAAVVLLLFVSLPASSVPFTSEPYEMISIEQVFARKIIRRSDDSVYSGQIKDAEGLADFEKDYGIKVDVREIDFNKQMLIFGINDRLASRVFQLLRQEWAAGRIFITLDYYDTGIRHRLPILEEGKKFSFVQVFLLERIEGISHVRVKDLVRGLSKVYGQ